MATGDATERTTPLLAPDAALAAVPGIGPASQRRLAAVGLCTVLDLVQFFPRRYRPLRELDAPDQAAVGELVRLRGRVQSARRAWLPGRRSMVTIVFACDGGGTFDVLFFNQPWLQKNYAVGDERLV